MSRSPVADRRERGELVPSCSSVAEPRERDELVPSRSSGERDELVPAHWQQAVARAPISIVRTGLGVYAVLSCSKRSSPKARVV